MSLLLVITMMGGLLFVTSAAANLIWTVSKSSRSIGESENAYFAALAAVERALYEYEKGSGSVLNLQVATARPLPGNAAATYTTSAVVDAQAPTFTNALYADDNGKPVSDITTSNRLFVTIPSGKTFFFSLATKGVNYPSNIEIALDSGANVRVTTFALGAQSSQTFTANGDKFTFNIPSSTNNDAKFMATNLSGAVAKIRVKPTGGNLPLGITVTGAGQYKNTLRKVEVEKPNWVFY